MNPTTNELLVYAGLWIGSALVIGAFGANKPIGYGRVFLFSLVLSPLIGLIIAIASPSHPNIAPEYQCKHCSFKATQYSMYCPRCAQDIEGFTFEQNKARFTATR